MSAIALLNVARTSPTLPPSAMIALAMCRRMPVARQHDADVLENLGNRCMRLVHGDLDRAHLGERRKDSIGDRAGGAFEELVTGVLEGIRRGLDHVGIGNRVGQAVAVRGFREVGKQIDIDHEALAHFGLMLHHAVTGMDDDALDEDRIGHRFSSIAVARRSACTVSATSCARMMPAPRWTAIRCAAIDPPRRSSGSAGPTVAMKRLREAPTRIGRPKALSSSSRASAILLCSLVLPKPMPGSSTILPSPMPAWAAI